MTLPPLPSDAALFLDFDGVLVEIAPAPDAITVPDALPGLLAALHTHLDGAIALISGRGVADLQRYLPDFPGIYIGGHGAEAAPEAARAHLPAADHPDPGPLQADLIAAADALPGVLYEPKTHGGVLHYRAAPEHQAAVKAAAQKAVATHPGFEEQGAKMAVELRPAGVGKDRALDALMAAPHFAGRTPVYAGDDLTDEPAMARALALGGLAIKIGDGDTVAPHRLDSPSALADWLGRAI